MMMAYGMFVFELKTAPYQQLQRQASWRQAGQARVGHRPSRQFLGPGDDTITLTGTLLPQLTGGQSHLDALRAMADEGAAWPLIEGNGTYYGLYVLERLDEDKSHQMRDGSAQRIGFTLTLQRVSDERSELLGNAAGAAARALTGTIGGLLA
ncbi:MAG: phage tail protein [Pseudomonadota bacterium]